MQRPLYVYVTATAVVWAILLSAARLFASPEHFKTVSAVCGGFAIGMLAMFIAVHLYRWR